MTGSCNQRMISCSMLVRQRSNRCPLSSPLSVAIIRGSAIAISRVQCLSSLRCLSWIDRGIIFPLSKTLVSRFNIAQYDWHVHQLVEDRGCMKTYRMIEIRNMQNKLRSDFTSLSPWPTDYHPIPFSQFCTRKYQHL